jgi:arylsulfatase A-like enzyme
MRRRWQTRFSTEERFQDSLRRYHALVSGLDSAVGEILAELERAGELERTAVLFSSDNGFFLGEHGLADKWLPHEESIRVPLLVRAPRGAGESGGLDVDSLALDVDLAPTLLELAGVPMPAQAQGRSLLPLARGEALPGWRQDFFYEFRWGPPPEALAAGIHPVPRSLAVRGQRFKYVRFPDEPPPNELLFDLVADPYEDRNLAAIESEAERVATLRARLLELEAAVIRDRPE